ncbi:deleted in malignant brain tumors 1 protein-like isoform X2 [Oncorhynchus keta]|uniref:deleted in malignant brain tumors 1 protein-like isoform X3 n=1 Tax=Oncorhynchus keta TaxID=8018 RepID=UPI0015FB20CA|nr:deleted in malignant brain tumors 1 protein-like isoform X3 [Oncorhynchus keta]XP_052332044.1 deleted in malignant brain tumors 1 protein-like isoform X2 [Oncorhynchus keta]
MEIATTLLVLCSVIVSHGTQGQWDTWTTAEPWRTVDPSGTSAPCGGYLTASKGQFNSPNYPRNYPNNADCTWNIQTPSGSQIVQLEFLYVNLEGDFNCKYDSISVYDGYSAYNRLLGKLCGGQSSTFYSTGSSITVRFTSDSSSTYKGFQAEYRVVDGGSCRHNCGYQVGNCSCSYSCEYRGNCCQDYQQICYDTTTEPSTTDAGPTAQPSCRYNCGYTLGSCSCSSSCQYYGNCCYDYNEICYGTTTDSLTTAADPATTGGWGSCRYSCGSYAGGCSCTSSCRYNGNCCHDYNDYCQSTTYETGTTSEASCRYNCGFNLGRCSCSSSCQYYGNCCYDYNTYCPTTPPESTVSGTHPTCGGNLHDSGSISSPYYPEYYHDNAYCVWHLSAPSGQRIFMSFTDLELENCCSCDYISVYDGSSVTSQMLGTICDLNNDTSLAAYHSTSNYMTVLFRSDQSVVSRGFRAMFSSSLASNQGRVDCSSDNMNIVIQRSYLLSMGYDGYNLYLNDQHCRPQVNSYQVVFSFPINTCGTQRKFEKGRVEYINAVRAYRSDSGEITRQSHFLLHVECHMEQDTMVQVMYKTNDEGNGTITGTGRFNSTMAFFTNSNFYSEITQTPYKITLNQNMYVQVRLRRSDSSLHLFLDTCVASPSPHDFQTRSYDLVRNGCRRDPTYYSYTSGTSSYARFTFQAFKFLRADESVYLQCKVTICQASDYNSRCRRGCRTRKARDLGSSQGSHTLILGPIQLKDLEKPDEKVAEKEEIQAKVEP